MRVIITDTRYKMALAPIRALAARGDTVVCTEYEETEPKLRLGFKSRCCTQSALLPKDETGMLARLSELCADGERPVILPVGRTTLQTFSEHPEMHNYADFIVSSPAVLANADDKAHVRALAQILGIPVPLTFSHPDEADGVQFPLIVKYRNGEALGLHSWERYKIVNTPQELCDAWEKMHARQKNPIIQEYIVGRDIGLAIVTDKNADPVDFLCYISEREYPIAGGPTCLCRTVFDRELLKYGCKLLKALNFTGLAMLDFCGSLNNPRLLEINPRLWGSAMLANVASSPLYESWVAASNGTSSPIDPEAAAPKYNVGATMRFTPQNIAAALQELKVGKFSLKAHIKNALDPKIKDGVYSAADAKPYFRYVLNLMSHK